MHFAIIFTSCSSKQAVEKLRAIGVNMYKQQIHKIFMNRFYCGMISHGMLNGRVIEGTHEQMISKDVFLKVNGFIKSSTKYGVPHKRKTIIFR